MTIQFILLAGLAVAATAMMRGPRHRQLAARRLLGLGVVVLGTVAVARPDLTTRVSHLVGVGRGTDLLLYVAVLAFVFVGIAQWQRIARLESRLNVVTRELALRTPHDEAGPSDAAQQGQTSQVETLSGR